MEKIITRKTLVKNLTEVKNKIDELREKEYVFNTKRSIPGYGEVSSINSVKVLINAYNYIHRLVKNNESAIEGLGLDKLGINLEEDTKIFGYTIDEWDADLKTAANRIGDTKNLTNLEKARDILEKNLGEDEKFEMDMNSVAELLNN